MQVLHVCSEMFPLLKTGGLADVIGALPAAQIAEGIDTRVLLPAFPDIRRGVVDAQVVTRRDTFAGRITLLYGHFNGVGIYLIDALHLYDRPGSPYHDTNQHAYPDNVLRFALLGWVGSEMASGLDPFWRPDVVHAHDWHAGLTPAYLAARGRPAKSVFTVHNLAYQGMFYSWHMNDIELPWSFYNMHGLEFNGQISFLKAGLYYADHITAVSPTYAREITEPQYAYGMEGLLRQRHHEGRLSGILNGVDDGIWSPQNDLLLPMRYDRDTLEEKAENKRQLQIAMGLKVDDKAPLFAVVPARKGWTWCLKRCRVCLSRAASWRCWAPAIRCCRKVSSPPPPNTRAKWVCRLATMRPSPTALWAAPTSFWSRAALNPAA